MIAPNIPGKLSTTPAVAPASKPRRLGFVFWFSILVVGLAGSAFLFKLVEFMLTFRSVEGNESMGFAIMPVVTYLIVATGFACLFVWSYLSGHFKNVEGPKYRMLEMQDEFDRRK